MEDTKPKKKRSWLKWIGLFFFLSFMICWCLIAFNHMRQSDAEVIDFFNDKPTSCLIERLPFLKDSIRLIRTGLAMAEAETTVLFIHGAPGSSDAFYNYLDDSLLIHNAQLVSYDRPGYGYSDYGNSLTSIAGQAGVVEQILTHLKAKHVILVSHSYGCAIAGKFATDHHELVAANIMICPVIDPNHEKVFFFSSWPSLPILRHLFSGAFRVSSFEKMSHADELKAIEPSWKLTSVPTIVMHGAKDWIAPVENAYYLNDKISSKYLSVELDEHDSHFIVWTRQADVVNHILNFL